MKQHCKCDPQYCECYRRDKDEGGGGCGCLLILLLIILLCGGCAL